MASQGRHGIGARFLRAVPLASLLLVALPGVALAEDDYRLRNQTSRTFTCGLQRERKTIIDRFLLRAGEEYRLAADRPGTRTLRCDTHAITPRWPMRSGAAYALVEDSRSGRIVLRELPPAS